MKLKKLEIFGFKSFADRTTIEFDQGITGVVGPNGSGKSNISDAIRWVLGEQSARSLRGGRMEDIIFGGTEKRKALAYCEVSLIFDNEDGALPIDYVEVAVTRRVYRSGDSEYYINRSACRLKDVVDLFRDSGIGREGYSIIGQGRVDEILSNKPEDRRNIFHEAAGIMKFRVRKEEASKNLETTQANLDRIRDIILVMDSQIGPLKQSSENARTYLKLTERLRQLEVNRFITEYEQLKARSNQIQQRLEELNAILEQQKGDIALSQEGLKEENEALEALEATWLTQQQQLTELNSELSELEGAVKVCDERLRFMDQEDQRLAQQGMQAKKKAEGLENQARQRESELSDVGDARARLHQQILDEEAALAAMDQHTADEEAALEAGKQAAMDALTQLGDVRSSLSRLEGRQNAVKERLEQLAGQMGRSGESSGAWQQLSDEITQKIDELKAQDQKLKEQIQAFTQRQSCLQTEQTQLASVMSKARDQQQQGRTRLSMLQNMKRDYEGYNNTVRQLLKDAQRDENLGACVDAVVAEIVSVPQNYLLAIETALGAAREHIITRDEVAAKQLIGHLRSRQYGRATFLPLNVIKGRVLSANERREVQLAGLCGVASELVECNPKYRAIVDNLLGRTLIAQDLDVAIAISRACQASLRVVTIQGDVMNPGGSMTGGSIRARVTSILGRDQEIEQTAQRVEQLNAQLAQMESKQEKILEELSSVENERSLLIKQQHTLEVDTAREKERLDKAQANAIRYNKEQADLVAEDERLKGTLQDIAAQMEKIHTASQAMETGNEDARKQLAKRQHLLNLLREERDEKMDHLGMLRATAMADERDHAAVKAQIDRDRREAQTYCEEERLAAKAREENVLRRGEILRQQQENSRAAQDLQSEIEKAKGQVSEAQLRREELRRHIQSENALLHAREQEELKTNQRQLELNAQSEKTQNELSALQNRIWDAYELTYANALPLRDDSLMGEQAQKEMEALRKAIRALGPVNLESMEEYARVKGQYEEYMTQSSDLSAAKARLEEMIRQLTGQMETLFRASFRKLNASFGRTFQALFGGGQAFIKLEDESNILESGIEMHAQPPGKKLQMMSLLSGGERALTAIALLFAILECKPTPFCILDEIEAALDEANIYHFTDYVRQYSQKTQFVVITHRKSTMECCDMLYGVTMQEKGISKMIRVRMSDIVEQEVS